MHHGCLAQKQILMEAEEFEAFSVADQALHQHLYEAAGMNDL